MKNSNAILTEVHTKIILRLAEFFDEIDENLIFSRQEKLCLKINCLIDCIAIDKTNTFLKATGLASALLDIIGMARECNLEQKKTEEILLACLTASFDDERCLPFCRVVVSLAFLFKTYFGNDKEVESIEEKILKHILVGD